MSITHLFLVVFCFVFSISISVSSSVSSLLYFKIAPAQINIRTILVILLFVITIFVVITNFAIVTNYALYRNIRLSLIPIAIITYIIMLYVLIKPLKDSAFASKSIFITTTFLVVVGIIVEVSNFIVT